MTAVVLRRANAYLSRRYATAIGVVATVLLMPAVGAASTGGGGIAPSGQAQAQSGNRTVTASANGITLTTRASGFMRRTMTFTGYVSTSKAGSVVEIERSGHQTQGQWVPTVSATVAQDGSFTARWRVTHVGQFAVRAVMTTAARRSSSGGGSSSAAGPAGQSRSGWPTVDVILYRFSKATLYGPGLWGNHTACGEVLHRKTLGVANRTLPCGTRVSLYYQGRTIEVPVIDRGPYANGANWDITMATARALHLYQTDSVGAAAIPPR